MIRDIPRKFRVFQKKHPDFFEVFKKRSLCITVLAVLAGALVFCVLSSVKDITVNIDGETKHIKTLNGDIFEALAIGNISWNWHDVVKVTEDNSDYTVDVTRSFPVTLTVEGSEYVQYVTSGSVKDLLENNNIILENSDNLNYSLEDKLQSGMNIVVNRVRFREYTEEIEIPFKTEKIKIMYTSLSDVPGNSAGKPGKREVTKRETLVDGKVVKTQVISDEVIAKAVNAVEYVAVKRPDKLVNGKSLDYKACLEFHATAYGPGAGRYTSTGKPASVGCVAINVNYCKGLKLGDKVYIETSDGSFIYGYATVCDTGTGRRPYESWIDIFLPSTRDCSKFGVRNVKVYVLK